MIAEKIQFHLKNPENRKKTNLIIPTKWSFFFVFRDKLLLLEQLGKLLSLLCSIAIRQESCSAKMVEKKQEYSLCIHYLSR